MAEVLITLGIIGIVAAMTIPSLLYKYQIKHLESQFKKTYSALNQMAKLFYNDYEQDISNYVHDNGYHAMRTILLTYIKGMTVVDSSIWSTVDEDGNPTIKDYYNFIGRKYHPLCDDSATYTDINGVWYKYDGAPRQPNQNGPTICVDLNGASGPNTYGIDYFAFYPTTDNTVIPMGQPHENNTNIGGSLSEFYDSSFCYQRKDVPRACAYWAAINKSPKGVGNYWDDFIGKKQYKK